MTVMLFGQLKEIAGSDVLQVDNINNTDELKLRLESLFPQMASMKYAIAINKKVVSVNTAITQKCMVALLPPFSGG